MSVDEVTVHLRLRLNQFVALMNMAARFKKDVGEFILDAVRFYYDAKMEEMKQQVRGQQTGGEEGAVEGKGRAGEGEGRETGAEREKD